MENASKALIIAGSILIAIMIISLGIYIFNTYSESVKDSANLDEETISAFNSKITPYLGSSVSGSQVNALLQYCLSSNMSAKNSGETYKYITVNYTVDSQAQTLNGDSTSFKRVTTGQYYEVGATYGSDGLVEIITITSKSN